MKTKSIYLLALLLCIIAACKKDTSSPPPQPEPVKKYLAKVLAVGNDGSSFEVESCTWDSLHRLKTFEYELGYKYSFEFHYDSIGRVSSINSYDGLYGNFYLLFDWKNDKELNVIDYYTIKSDSSLSHRIQYVYLYDELHQYVEIQRFYVQDNNYRLDHTWYIEWDGDNIAIVYEIDSFGHQWGVISCFPHDDKHSPYNNFPNILIQVFNDRKIAYNPSKNNTIVPNYEYEYDEDGYPVGQYYLGEDGTRILIYKFEYYK